MSDLKLLPPPKSLYQSINHAYMRDNRTGEIFAVYDAYRLPDTGERVKLTVATYYLPTPSGKAGRKCEYAHAWQVSKGNSGRVMMLDDLDVNCLEPIRASVPVNESTLASGFDELIGWSL